MIHGQILLLSMKWFRQWGGAGLIALGIVDSSVVPIPGGMDLATVLLAAGNKNLWLYYALMSTSGSVLGGYLTYRIARKGGKETLDQRIPKQRLEQVERLFAKWGFGTVLMAAILPPPFPTVPFLAGAGALKYPIRKFVAALAIARLVRYTVVAYLASIYGRHVLNLLGRIRFSMPVVLSLVAFLVAAGAAAYFVWRIRRHRSQV